MSDSEPKHGSVSWSPDYGSEAPGARVIEELRVRAQGRLAAHQRTGLVISDVEVMGGSPVFEGTRIPVASVMSLVGDGLSVEEIQQHYPRLTAADVLLAKRMREDAWALFAGERADFWRRERDDER